MVKTQVQLPDELYREAKRIAREREMSLAEVVRRGIEYMARAYPPLKNANKQWKPPRPRNLGKFKVPVEDWRLLVNDPQLPDAS